MRARRLSKKQVRDVALEAYNRHLAKPTSPGYQSPGRVIKQYDTLPPEMAVVVDTLVQAFNQANGYNGKTTGSG